MDIKLNFINQSNDQNNSQVVIFPRNTTPSAQELPVAWTVIKNCGQGDRHPFTYPMAMEVSATDSWGNYTQQLSATPGQMFAMTLSESGDVLRAVGVATVPDEVQIRNDLNSGAISALVYKSGRLFARKANLVPGQMAVFQFEPKLWIGVASQIDEGELMNSAIVSDVNTEFNLTGVASADIVMTGGGPGQSSTPFQFQLQNVVYV